MKTQLVRIEKADNTALSARLDQPEEQFIATVLFAHCFTCGKDILAASRISRRLVGQGFAVLRFDFAGIGASDGEFADTNFSSNIQDLIDAANWLKENYAAPSLVIGHSLGGTATLAASDQLPEAKAFVTIGSPSDPRFILDLVGQESIRQIEANGIAEVNLEGRLFRIKRQFLNDVFEQKVLQKIRSLKRPLLIMHSPVDQIVNIDHATAIFHAASHPKSFISLGNADHLVTHQKDAEFVAGVISAWSSHSIIG